MIKKVLVANRGEIAVRIMRSCREAGIKSVAVFSEADRDSKHVRYADEAYYIGKSPSSESYLNADKIFEIAKQSSADAIHPGYGFLSENPEFANKCDLNRIIFIGPSADAINTMGDKITAREKMISSGVSVVPGMLITDFSEKNIQDIINNIGLPIMIKATAGGGGKGMRKVDKADQISEAVRAAKSEALASFGNDTVYIEKYISSPHHIEFQILADKYGNTIHLFERECSVQRRHQKIVEETPSPIMTESLRNEMGNAAVKAAKAVKYYGAGTIEFLVDDDLNYYFLEMNTRLQVEHPITERTTGIDLVKEQINIANGGKLPFKQSDIKQIGHAIECRVYAEDPENNFMPSPGYIKTMKEPHGFGVRCDGYIHEGYTIPIYYDPMISKLIVWGQTRDEAINRMKRALFGYKIIGVKSNIRFLEKIMETEDFIEGKYNTHFIEKNNESLFTNNIHDEECEDMAKIAGFLEYYYNIDKQNIVFRNNSKISKWKQKNF